MTIMSSETRFSTPRSLGRSSIPVLTSTQFNPATRSLPEPGPNNPTQPKNVTGNDKFLYTDGDIQEQPPEHNYAPIIAFPGDTAPNRAVKAYLLDVLTKTGWGLAIESGKEIRATINSFVGNGWALRKRYAENKLHNICPQYMTAVDDGAATRRKISASARSNIGKCIMREMERYFEMEDKAQSDLQYGSDGADTLVNGSKQPATSLQRQREVISQQNEVQQFKQCPRSRATLPDEWMSESLRARTKSRQSQRSEDDPPPMPQTTRTNRQSVFVSRNSAYAILVDIPDKPRPRNATKNTTTGTSSPLDERHPTTRIGNVGTSTYKRNSLLNPYHTVSGSSLPRPASSFGFRSSSRATWDPRPNKPESAPSQNLVGDAGRSPFFTTLVKTPPADIGLPAQTEVKKFVTHANEGVGATSHATPRSTDDHDDTANVTATDERVTTASLDDDENTGNKDNVRLSEEAIDPPQMPRLMSPALEHWNVATFDKHSTAASPDHNVNTDDDDHARLSEGSPEPLPRRRPMSPEHLTTTDRDDNENTEEKNHVSVLEEFIEPLSTQRPVFPEHENCIQSLPSTSHQPMTTLPPSPPNTYKDVPEDLDVIAPILPVFAPDEWGHIATINDIPVGSTTRRIAEREVEEALARTGEATAARQQMGLRMGRGRLKRWFRRAWGKIKKPKHGRPELSR